MKQRTALMFLTLVILLGPVSVAADSPGTVIDRFFDAYGDASLDRMLASYAPDAVFEDVNQRHHFEGKEQIGQLLGHLVAMHRKMNVTEKRRVILGNTVVVEYDYTGTLDGTAMGQAVGKEDCPDLEYVLPTTSWYEVEGGKIAHQRDFIDWATFLELREQMLAAGSEK